MVRGYRRLSPEVAEEIWVRLRAGHAAKPTARALGLSTGGVRAYPQRCGGIRPHPRCRSAGRVSLEEREEISRGLAADRSFRAIAAGLGRAASTISREVGGNGGRRRYRAAAADQQAWARATRPKRCKLAANPVLAEIVAEKLRRRWSPEQIAGWLKLTYPTTRRCTCPTRASTALCLSSPVVRCAGSSRTICAPAGSSAGPRAPGCPTAVAVDRGSCTSANGRPTPRIGPCPGTGRATWSSASR